MVAVKRERVAPASMEGQRRTASRTITKDHPRIATIIRPYRGAGLVDYCTVQVHRRISDRTTITAESPQKLVQFCFGTSGMLISRQLTGISRAMIQKRLRLPDHYISLFLLFMHVSRQLKIPVRCAPYPSSKMEERLPLITVCMYTIGQRGEIM
jgi:hypothetical protein